MLCFMHTLCHSFLGIIKLCGKVEGYLGLLTFLFHSYRFDLIFLMLDPQDEMFDRRLGGHLVSLYFKTHEDEEDENLVSIDTLNSAKVKHIQADTVSHGNLPVYFG